MNKMYAWLALSLFLVSSSVHATTEDTAPTLDYIRITQDGVYHLYGKNIPMDWNLMNIYGDDKRIDRSAISLTKEWAEVRNYYRNAGSFAIEKLKAEYAEGSTDPSYVTDVRTDAIKVEKSDVIGFNGQILRGVKANSDIITLPFIKSVSPDSPFSQLDLQTERKLVINWQEKNVIPFNGEYKDDEYYVNNQWITFAEKNLTERINTIVFKIDGLSSNYITVKKEGIILEKTSQVGIVDEWVTKSLVFTFPQPKNFINITGKEVYVNGEIIPNTQVTVWLGQVIIRYDLAKLPKDQDIVSIVLKDTNTNQYSNEQMIDVQKFSRLNITDIDTGKWGAWNFTFVIHGNINALLGDVYNFKININGVDYTREGTRELKQNADGSTVQDANWDDMYEIKNKIEFQKTGAGLEFDFSYNQLQNGENILYLKNENTGRESNKVSFMKWNNSSINYNYLTWATVEERNKKETVVFRTGKDIDKKLNPITMDASEKNISLGEIQLSNLKDNEYYNLSFALDTNLALNPFTNFMLDSIDMHVIQVTGTTTFFLEKQGYWKDFKTDMNLMGTINELFSPSEKTVFFNIKEIALRRFSNGQYEPLASLKNPLQSNLFYEYIGTKCFDGTKDFCSLVWEQDPVLTLRYRASWVLNNTSTSTQWTRKNITTILSQEFTNSKFTRVQEVLIKKYNELKTKGSVHLSTFRNATNTLLLALKNYELRNDMEGSIIQVKSSLKTLNEVLRQSKK